MLVERTGFGDPRIKETKSCGWCFLGRSISHSLPIVLFSLASHIDPMFVQQIPTLKGSDNPQQALFNLGRWRWNPFVLISAHRFLSGLRPSRHVSGPAGARSHGRGACTAETLLRASHKGRNVLAASTETANFWRNKKGTLFTSGPSCWGFEPLVLETSKADLPLKGATLGPKEWACPRQGLPVERPVKLPEHYDVPAP